MLNNQSPNHVVPDPCFPSGTRVICLAPRMIATIPYTNHLDYKLYRRVQVLDYTAAVVYDCRTGDTRPMTDAEIERVSRANDKVKRVS